MVVLHALGQCLIRTAITSITPRADMCFALASFLTRERGNRVPRRQLERLFWPYMRAADASHSLSELIRKLRRKGIHIQRDQAACIWLPRDAVVIDIETLGTEPPTSIAARDLSVLPGYAPRASDAFNDWVDDWRAQLRLRVLDSVVAAISAPDDAGDWDLALTLADQALRIDGQNEMALAARARAAEGLSRRRRPLRAAATAVEVLADRPPRLAAHNAIRIREKKVAAAHYNSRHEILPDAGDTVLVGRDDTMERLRAEATCVFLGAVRSGYISAPSGIGKSRVVRELSGWMRAKGGVVCTTACGRHDGHRPLSAFIQAVPQLQTLPGAAGCSPASLSCLASITQLSGDVHSLSEHDGSRYRSEAIRESVTDLIDAISEEQPLLMIVEDVHWIDPLSWALLRTIATTAQRSVYVVCTSRVRWQHASWGEPDTFNIEELSALRPTVARTHMQNCLTKLDRTTDERFIDWCVETSAGNPYFVEELVNYWITTGEQYTAPPSLVALVEARLACLRPDAIRVIQAAAILGKNSTLELLQKVLEFPTHIMFASVEELGEAGLISAMNEIEPTSSPPILCRHDIVMRAATRGLSAHGRTLLHHSAARALEETASSDSASRLWDCADHWRAAGQFERSIRAAIACAKHLHDIGLVHEAVKTCESALQLCGDDRSQALVLRAMAQSQYSARDWPAFCKTATRVRSIEGSSAAAPVHDTLELCELSAQRNLRRDWSRALDRATQCVRSLRAAKPHRIQAAVIALKIASNLGDLETMDSVYEQASSIASAADDCVTDNLSLAMIYHAIRGDTAISAAAARELLTFIQQTLPPRHRLTLLLDIGDALRRGGVAGEAETVYGTLYQTAVSLRCFGSASDACHRLIEMHATAGQMEQANAWVGHYRQLRRPASELRAHRHLRLAMARVYLREQQWHQVAALIDCPASAPAWNDRVTQFRSAALAIKLRLEIGHNGTPDKIVEWTAKLEPLNRLLRSTGSQDYETYSLYLGYRRSGNTVEAGAFLKRYVEHERRDAAPISNEIEEELRRLALTPEMRGAVSELPACAEATGAKST